MANTLRTEIVKGADASIGRNPWIREIPGVGSVLGDWADRKIDPEACQRTTTLRRNLKRNLTRIVRLGRDAPLKFVGGTRANKAGLQIVRSLARQASWRSRPNVPVAAELQDRLDELVTTGVCVWEDYLPPDDFSTLTRLADEILERLPVGERRDAFIDVGYEDTFREKEGLTAIRELLLQGRAGEVIGGASRRRRLMTPAAGVMELTPRGGRLDMQDVLHTDVFYPAFKAFLYLRPTGVENGAFHYAPGSHRFSSLRLRHEYWLSNTFLEQSPDSPSYPMVELTGEQRRVLRIDPKPIVGPENTMILFNVMGFHRRGDFLDADQGRRLAWLDYRTTESWLCSLLNLVAR